MVIPVISCMKLLSAHISCKLKPICMALLLWMTGNNLYGQQAITLEKVTGDGLTNYYIKCIQQDKSGFLWFGTEEGLFRYDGYTFTAYKNFPADNQSLCNNNIEFLYPEEDGSLWVGSRGGLSCINSTGP